MSAKKTAAPDYGQVVPLGVGNNAAYVHRLKCWSENFDALLGGGKSCEIRAEDDRKFKAGDAVELTRTDREGKETEPRVRLVVEITHVERYAGPLELVASKPGSGGESAKLIPVAVLSLSRRGSLHHPDTPAYEAPTLRKMSAAEAAKHRKGAP